LQRRHARGKSRAGLAIRGPKFTTLDITEDDIRTARDPNTLTAAQIEATLREAFRVQKGNTK